MTTSTDPNKKYLVIKADSHVVDVKDVRAYLEEIKKHTVQYKFLIFDFTDVTAIPHAALRTLTFAVNFVNQPNTKVALLANAFIKQAVSDSGLDKLISCHDNLESALEGSASQSAHDRAYLTETINEAVKMALRVVSSTEVVGVPLIEEKHSDLKHIELGAIVGLTGITFRGTLTLGMSKQMFLKLMSKMLDYEYTDLATEIEDGPAELLNMILGHLKVPLNERDLGIVAAIPTTVRGSNIKIVPAAASDSTFVLNFNSEFGDFYVVLTHYEAIQVAS